eukprot:7141292-Prymnesium_polylepis.3
MRECAIMTWVVEFQPGWGSCPALQAGAGQQRVGERWPATRWAVSLCGGGGSRDRVGRAGRGGRG